jgi:nucleoid-associated protein YgaU
MAESTRFRGGTIALGAIALLAVGGLIYLAAKPNLQPTPPAPAAPAPGAPSPAANAGGPQFDVVRVDAAGNTVIAGRATPGAVVTVKSGDSVIGTATADAAGAFALIPAAPLPPGAQQLTLSEILPGGQVVAGQASASIDVPANGKGNALAVLSGPGGSQVLSGQGPQPGTLGLGTVDYDANGHAIFSGTAPSGEHVTLSLDGKTIGSAAAGPDGRWKFSAKVPEESGTLSLAGSSGAAVTAPFALETLPDAVANGHIVIVPGQNLWLIARHVYGHGTMYTLIYNANASQIRDPNLIYPGQAFSLPKPQG